MSKIDVDRIGAVEVLTIDNQNKRNAFSGNMIEEFLGLLKEAENTPSVRCVVITGAGSAFSSGHDLSEIFDEGTNGLRQENNQSFTYPTSMLKPTIAAINGAAYAGGLILALSCDLRIGCSNSSFCVPGARIGLLPIGGQLSRLFRLMPFSRALEMVLTAEPMLGTEAHAIGFVNRLVEDVEVLSTSLKIAEKIASNSPSVIQSAKKGIEGSLRHGLLFGEAFEWEMGPVSASTEDASEGVRAFFEKRSPKFSNR